MEPSEYILAIVNMAAGLGFAFPLSSHLYKLRAGTTRSRIYVVLIGVYLFESVAITSGMLLPVFSFALALVWGAALGRWLPALAPRCEIYTAALFFSLYSSLPAASFLLVPVMAAIGGWSVMDAETGYRFGIPDFVPWPLNTILGFFLAVPIGTTMLKTIITTGESGFIIRRRESATADGSRAS